MRKLNIDWTASLGGLIIGLLLFGIIPALTTNMTSDGKILKAQEQELKDTDIESWESVATENPTIPMDIHSYSLPTEFATSDGQVILDNEWEHVPMSVEFWSDDGEKCVGKLWFGDGVMKFEGNMEESAELFFEHFLKRVADAYIKERLESCRSELVSKAIISGHTWFLPWISIVFNKERQ